MGISRFDAANYQIQYIPQRLSTLEVCVLACYSVLSGKADVTPLAINLGESLIVQSNLNLFIGIALDAGLVANRTLLNFLGIKLDNGDIVNQSYALTIEKFGLPLTPVVVATQILNPSIPDLEMRKIWIDALNTASKSIAHFTEAGAIIRVARLGYACFGTSLLIRKYYFQAKSYPEPASLISSEAEPKLGGVWNSVDPSFRYQH